MANEDEEGTIVAGEIGEITELLERRLRVQGWLDGVAERRAETTPAVYERVKADYEQRLERVSGRLTERRPDVERLVARHRSRIEMLEQEHEVAAVRLEEADLRYRVGEYGEAEWGEYRDENESKARELERKMDREREALGRLERVLGELVTEGRAMGAPGQVGDQEDRGGDEKSEVLAEPESAPEDGSGYSFVKGWGRGQRGLVDARPAEKTVGPDPRLEAG